MFLSLGADSVFGAYVVLAIRAGVAPSRYREFTAYFVALHTVEAILLRRAEAG